nr:SusC/RagA family TonB-linked outer membrane protein [Chitinophagaceae bacterium]
MKNFRLFFTVRQVFNSKLLLFFFLLKVSVITNGQLYTNVNYATSGYTKKINDTDLKITLRKALGNLSNKFNVQFGYQTEVVKSLFVEDESWKVENSVEQALTLLLKPFNLKYKKINSNNYVIKLKVEDKPAPAGKQTGKISEMDIMIENKETVAENTEQLRINFFPVTGRVTNDNGEGIPDVSVTIKGTTNGTTTNNTGSYNINVENENAILVFSSVGFITQEIKVGSNKLFNIVLTIASNPMNEVVVVGYNTQRRGDLTGSVASVKSKDIANLPATSLSTALQGRVPGAYISQIDGNPNSSSSIIIRGPLSINGGDPLFVVDGVPFQGTGFNFNNQDIESIDILKDASAAAIYGYRAAGGVVLIKTKKGSSGKLKVGVNSSVGVRKIFGLPTALARDEYIDAKKAFGFNVEDLYGPQSGWSSLPNTNWLNEVYRTGVEHNHTLFLSGGSDRSNFYMSGNYGKIDGTRIGNSIERYTFRLNTDHKLGKRFKVGQTLYGSFIKEDPNASTNQGNVSFRNTPVQKIYDETNPIGGWGKAPKGFQGGNDVHGALGNYTRNENYELLLTVNFDAEIIRHLVFRAVFGTGLNGASNYSYIYKADLGNAVTDETFGKYLNKGQSFIATYTLAYDKSFGQHSVKALAGYEARKANFSDVEGKNRNPLVPIPQDFNLVQSISGATVRGRSADVYDRV